MKLVDLLKKVNYKKIIGKKEIDIKEITIDSNKVVQKSLFICINGNSFDGHDYVKQAERYGATAILCEKEVNSTLTQIIVDNTRQVMGKIAANFYGNVDEKMKLIAVIGTNGKTTTSHLIKEIMEKSNMKCGLIGTLGTYYQDKFLEQSLTTPDPIELHKTLFEMYNSGVKNVVMEVSAHAIYLDKVKDLKFFCAVFTNFSQDHLDFFKNIENYKKAKLKFFKENQCKYVVSNSDDELGREISKMNSNCVTYGLENPADVFAVNVQCKDNKTSFYVNIFDYVGQVDLQMIGFFNVYNALACSCVCSLLGIKAKKTIEQLCKIKGVKGRLERVYQGEYSVFIDYAHTPDGLNKVLMSLKPFVKNRLICVFGCGGNRDQLKRSIMGEVSTNLADFTVITSDNPRYEDPMDIIGQIEKGAIKTGKKYIVIEDREQAVYYALDFAERGDIILIAGKGSEQYQEVLGIKKMYNDVDTVNEYIRSKKN